jgi:predicted small secreted protein
MGKRSIQLLVLLLGGMLLLAGCQNRGPGDDAERRGSFYTGVIGGWTRP